MSGNKYKLHFTPIASEDLDEIYGYIAIHGHNPTAAESLIDKIEDSILRLKEHPFSGSLVEDELLMTKGYRKLVVDNYIALYLVDEVERTAIIVRVLHSRRSYRSLL